MQWHAVQYDETLMSNAVFRHPQSGGSFHTGGPVISRVSRVKTATMTIATTNTSQATLLNSASSVSLSPMDTATASSIATTATALSTMKTTPQPTSTDSTPAAPQVSVPVNTLIAIIGGTMGGIILLVFFIAVAKAFVRRRHIIQQETQSPGDTSNTLEKGGTFSGQRQYHVNDGSMDIPHPSPSAHPQPGMAQLYQAPCIVPDANVRPWPAAHDLHPRQVIAELPVESHAGHSQHGHRG